MTWQAGIRSTLPYNLLHFTLSVSSFLILRVLFSSDSAPVGSPLTDASSFQHPVGKTRMRPDIWLILGFPYVFGAASGR